MHVVNGVTYFVSDCCANYNDNGVVNRVSGTTTDTAFDVICANVKKGQLHLFALVLEAIEVGRTDWIRKL